MMPLTVPLETLTTLFNRNTPYRCERTEKGVEIEVGEERIRFTEADAREVLEGILVAIDAAPRRTRNEGRVQEPLSAAAA